MEYVWKRTLVPKYPIVSIYEIIEIPFLYFLFNIYIYIYIYTGIKNEIGMFCKLFPAFIFKFIVYNCVRITM